MDMGIAITFFVFKRVMIAWQWSLRGREYWYWFHDGVGYAYTARFGPLFVLLVHKPANESPNWVKELPNRILMVRQKVGGG